MTIKKYLTKPEEILALRDTDTKIYIENNRGYFKYVNDIVCYFEDDYCYFNSEIMFGPCYEKKYILVEEPVKEADEKDIDKLCRFWDGRDCIQAVGLLERLNPTEETSLKYRMRNGFDFGHCRRLTPAEVAEITGYKVEE
jgi:hypothetical protein